MSEEKKAYLGDGLYVEDQGFQFRLFTQGAIDAGEEVFLDDHVLQSFFAFIAKARKCEIKIVRVDRSVVEIDRSDE